MFANTYLVPVYPFLQLGTYHIAVYSPMQWSRFTITAVLWTGEYKSSALDNVTELIARFNGITEARENMVDENTCAQG